ncbi:uncharacterized protein PGRI_038530 [Penicillium griseofulvum]|uniref:Uncharacterized protein n=1 Tax=Penicillium patulum TaxID=5078 RepID=A0A135LDR8_PENPA|nr:uncharacterized protein PGRI_038530 [Penicillium griseofulvum]KXG47107.1 hypothetical protein PGRI_038530 [Penicillium griseofulvum]
MDAKVILGLKVKNAKMIRDLGKQNQDLNRLIPEEPKWVESAVHPQHTMNEFGPSRDSVPSLHDDQDMKRSVLEEPKWVESAVNPQHMMNNFGPSWDSMPSHHDDLLKQSQEQNGRLVMFKGFQEQNAQLRYTIKQQEKIILNLAQYQEEATAQLEQHTARVVYTLKEQNKKIAGLECEKVELVRDLKEQTRIAYALEKRDRKMRKIFGDTASIMFLELEYREELISKMAPNDGEFFQPTHETLVDLVENIEQWTADDEHSDMMFNLEHTPPSEQLYEELLSRFDEQSYQLKIQEIKLDRQKSIIDEQTSIISELNAQKRKMASDLEEQNGKLALILEHLQGNDEKGTSHLLDRILVYKAEQHALFEKPWV